MNRVRRLFVVFGAVLMMALLILVGLAVNGLQREQYAHHEAVAGRLFDEMERTLTELLREEERRPAAQYGAADGPLRAAPTRPYVVGYFQIGTDGRFSMPEAPDSAPADSATELRYVAVRDAVRAYDDGVRFSSPTLDLFAAGSTVGSGPNLMDPGFSRKSSISSFNVGSTSRAGRNARTEWVPSDVAPVEPTPAAPAPVAAVGLQIQPMQGRVIGADQMVLVRAVDVDGGTLRQGLVVSLQSLAGWLTERTLLMSPLSGYARVRIGPDVRPDLAADYAFTHRFAEPFEGVGAALDLSALPDAAAGDFTWSLAIGLLIAAPLGLLALYRMASVVVRFAERRNDFVSAVTHELKTPLTSIRMYGEMLRDGMVLDEARRQTYYTHITAESERLSRLVDNVLELARLEKGTRQMSMTVGEPAAALRAVADVFGPQARNAGFAIEVDAADDLPQMWFDRDALSQVLFNLVDNAVKYARDADDRRIVLGARAIDGQVVVTVRDHGPGVPEAQLRHIFEPFYRGQRELTRTAKGTGIGLALVDGLVERMGGTVTGANAPGGGFEVRIALAVA